MISFTLSLVALLLGYFFYGRLVERIVGPDNRVTPAIAKADGNFDATERRAVEQICAALGLDSSSFE